MTGVGAVSPCGNTMDKTWDALVAARSGIAPFTSIDTEGLKTTFGGECTDFDPTAYWSKTELRRNGRFTHFAVAASTMAAEMAGLETADDGDRGGTFIGVGLGGLPEIVASQQTLESRGARRVSPFFILQAAPNIAAGEVAIRYGLRGASFATATACSSGSHAIGEAFRAVRDGRIDYAIAGGAEAVVTRLTVAGFNQMRALSVRNDAPTEASRPFDAGRDGFVLGEGAASLILETEERAKARGATILAELRGYGASTDASHATKPSQDGSGLALAMKKALIDGEVPASEVDYVNPHATATPAGDAAEARAIHSVFGARATDGLLVSGTKGMTGHLLGASGALEAAIVVYTITRGVVPPTLNLETPDEAALGLDLVADESRERAVRYAMSTSTGFGGHNASITFAAPGLR